jgi:hypothetical protein
MGTQVQRIILFAAIGAILVFAYETLPQARSVLIFGTMLGIAVTRG